ncbi:MAG: SDR family oxidoreductase [Bacteroidales bacterium]|nr:SDR family oxidoreductase [Bacteroidales bacterium]
MELQGKVAWVTGGATGIGAATSKKLHEEGCKLLVTSRRQDVGDAFVAQFGDDAIFVSADMADIDSLQKAADAAVKKWGRLDLLFNSAGASANGALLADDPEKIVQSNEAWEYVLKVNLGGSYHASRIAARYMVKNEPEGYYGERGAIILVASMAADKVFTPYTPEDLPMMGGEFAWSYSASKGGILSLSRDLAVNLGQYGIRVNTIKPGLVVTDIALKYDDHHTFGDALFCPRQIFPRIEGAQPEHVASLAVEMFKNTYINRTAFAVDAGVVG